MLNLGGVPHVRGINLDDLMYGHGSFGRDCRIYFPVFSRCLVGGGDAIHHDPCLKLATKARVLLVQNHMHVG